MRQVITRTRARHQLRRARAELRVARHIIHFAVPAEPEPFGEAVVRGREFGVRNADGLETELAPPLLDVRRERRIVHGRAS